MRVRSTAGLGSDIASIPQGDVCHIAGQSTAIVACNCGNDAARGQIKVCVVLSSQRDLDFDIFTGLDVQVVGVEIGDGNGDAAIIVQSTSLGNSFDNFVEAIFILVAILNGIRIAGKLLVGDIAFVISDCYIQAGLQT